MPVTPPKPKVTPTDVLSNTAYCTFLGRKIPTNTTHVYSLFPPVHNKTVNKIAVEGTEADLEYNITVINQNNKTIDYTFEDFLEGGSEYIDGSFTVNGKDFDVTKEAQTLTANIPLPPKSTTVIKFYVKGYFNLHEGQPGYVDN